MLAAARRWQLQWCWAQATPDIAALELTSSVPGTYLGDALVVYAEQHAQRGAPLGSAPARHRPWHLLTSAAPLAAPQLGTAPARLSRLLRAHLAASGSSALAERDRAHGRPATVSGARASRLQSRRFHCL